MTQRAIKAKMIIKQQKEKQKPQNGLNRRGNETVKETVPGGLSNSAYSKGGEIFDNPSADNGVIGEDYYGHNRRQTAEKTESFVKSSVSADGADSRFSANGNFGAHQGETESEGKN